MWPSSFENLSFRQQRQEVQTHSFLLAPILSFQCCMSNFRLCCCFLPFPARSDWRSLAQCARDRPATAELEVNALRSLDAVWICEFIYSTLILWSADRRPAVERVNRASLCFLLLMSSETFHNAAFATKITYFQENKSLCFIKSCILSSFLVL